MEKKTAEDILKKYIDRDTSPIGDYIKAMEEYSSLQSEEIKEQLLHMTQERDYWFELRKIESAEKDKEIERLREVLMVVNTDFEQWPCKESTWKLVEQALSNQPIESDKDRRIKELEDELNEVKLLHQVSNQSVDILTGQVTELEEQIKDLGNQM